MIDLIEVRKIFNAGRSNQFTALDGVSCRIGRGEVTVLKGPSGSGKTTLLTLVGCMARPTSGRILLHGVGRECLPGFPADGPLEIASLPERFLTGIRRGTFGFVFQHFNLVRGIGVLENVMLPAYPTGEGMAGVRRRALQLLETFGIARHAGARIEQLSGGELQRVAIVRSLINDPATIIADEPTAHLDSKLSGEFMEIVAGLKSVGKSVLIASHDPIVYDASLVDVVIEMRDGRIVGAGGHP